MARLFIGVPLPLAARKALSRQTARLVAGLSEAAGGLRPVKPENYHITIQFLGETSEEATRWLIENMPRWFGKMKAVEIALEGLGAFPARGSPRVVWKGVSDPGSNLENLVELSRGPLESYGFALDSRKFRPHVTVAYVKRNTPRSTGRLLREMIADQGEERVRTVVGEVGLYESRPARGGSIYTPLLLL